MLEVRDRTRSRATPEYLYNYYADFHIIIITIVLKINTRV